MLRGDVLTSPADTKPPMTEALRRALEEVADRFEARTYAYIGGRAWNGQIRPWNARTGRITITDVPKAFHRDYAAALWIKDDPVAQYAMSEIGPVLWSEAHSALEELGVNPLFKEVAADHGLQTGVVIPIHGPGAEFGLLSLSTTSEAKARALIEGQDHSLLKAAVGVHRSARGPVRIEEIRDRKRLTDREAELLYWIADGKSDRDIADLTGLTHHTVQTMVKRLREKLNANTRAHAVSRIANLNDFPF